MTKPKKAARASKPGDKPEETQNGQILRLLLPEIRTQAAASRLRIYQEVSAYLLEAEKLVNKLHGFTKDEKTEVRLNNQTYLANVEKRARSAGSLDNLPNLLNSLSLAFQARREEKATRVRRLVGALQADSVRRIGSEVASFCSYLAGLEKQPADSLTPGDRQLLDQLRRDYLKQLERSFYDGLVAMSGSEEKLARERKQWITKSYKTGD